MFSDMSPLSAMSMMPIICFLSILIAASDLLIIAASLGFSGGFRDYNYVPSGENSLTRPLALSMSNIFPSAVMSMADIQQS